MISTENQLLIKASIAGERSAQGAIYKKYAKAMYHIAIRMIPEVATAKDITQDVFIKVFTELNKFRGESTLGAWIKRITINTCLNHLKREGRLRKEDLQEDILLVEDSSDEIDRVEMKVIHEAIKALPDGSRTVLTLYLLEGYQHKEIAEILEISVSTSKTQYRRGKQLLKESLKTVYYNED